MSFMLNFNGGFKCFDNLKDLFEEVEWQLVNNPECFTTFSVEKLED